MIAGSRRAPPTHCTQCARLVALRHELQAEWPDWHNAPVASFGDPAASLLIVGLAPGMHGANRTGRPFTGDYAGLVLYPALKKFGWSRGTFDPDGTDDLELTDCRITNAVRCLPPQNKPVGQEINTCRTFLTEELTGPAAPKIALTLGRIAFESTLRALGQRPSRFSFRHGGVTRFDDGPTIVASYHTSRYNMNTGRLTEAMFDQVLSAIRQLAA